MKQHTYWKPAGAEGFVSIRGASRERNIPIQIIRRAIDRGVLKVYTLPVNDTVKFIKLDELDEALKMQANSTTVA